MGGLSTVGTTLLTPVGLWVTLSRRRRPGVPDGTRLRLEGLRAVVGQGDKPMVAGHPVPAPPRVPGPLLLITVATLAPGRTPEVLPRTPRGPPTDPVGVLTPLEVPWGVGGGVRNCGFDTEEGV